MESCMCLCRCWKIPIKASDLRCISLSISAEQKVGSSRDAGSPGSWRHFFQLLIHAGSAISAVSLRKAFFMCVNARSAISENFQIEGDSHANSYEIPLTCSRTISRKLARIIRSFDRGTGEEREQSSRLRLEIRPCRHWWRFAQVHQKAALCVGGRSKPGQRQQYFQHSILPSEQQPNTTRSKSQKAAPIVVSCPCET